MDQEEINLKESLKHLEEIISWFDQQQEIDVEKGLENVKKGATLIKKCKTRLGDLENEFKEVKESLEGEM